MGARIRSYLLQPFSGGRVTTHGSVQTWFLNDGDDHGKDRSDLSIEASVASGDCLIDLATTLDQATELLNDESEIARPQLEKVIDTLLYLQRRYKLVRKSPEHRQ